MPTQYTQCLCFRREREYADRKKIKRFLPMEKEALS